LIMHGFFFIGIIFPVLFIFLIFRFGLRFFDDLSNNPNRFNTRDRRQFYNGAGFNFFRGSRSIENRIFRAAFKHSGSLTVSDIVLETGLGVREAEEVINGLVDGTHVRMEVQDNGLVVYEFPEIISRFEKQ